MALTVNMPQLGESVTEGTIAKWLKHTGEPVARYESIAEVITDKVNAEIPAPADGVMGELIAAEGAVIAVGEPICVIETEVTADAPVAAAVAPVAPAPVAAAQPAPAPVPLAQPVAAFATNGGGVAPAMHMTPAVRMLVREHDVDIAQLRGSGIGGRVTKKDVLEYVQQRDAGGGAPALP
ncbi:MAG: biotin/lipoyl-containing protein, partial [Candidatus Dormibacteria bacterium]